MDKSMSRPEISLHVAHAEETRRGKIPIDKFRTLA
jgi:hypothetical protein